MSNFKAISLISLETSMCVCSYDSHKARFEFIAELLERRDAILAAAVETMQKYSVVMFSKLILKSTASAADPGAGQARTHDDGDIGAVPGRATHGKGHQQGRAEADVSLHVFLEHCGLEHLLFNFHVSGQSSLIGGRVARPLMARTMSLPR